MQTTKTYSFYCDDLNDGKYNILLDKAVQLKEFKNNISLDISQNPLSFLELSKFDSINKYRIRLDKCNNQDVSNAIEDVYVCYQNKKDRFLKNIDISIQDKISKSYYKVNTKSHKKGDFKKTDLKFKKTDFTKVVSYITRYYNDNFIDYITNKIPTDEKQLAFRNKVLYYIDKYKDRLLNLCIKKQKRIINNVFKYPVEFKSLSFTSMIEQKMNIINYNKNKSSIYNCIISLSGQKTDDGKIHIPVKHNTKYHGSLKHYYKEPCNKSNGQKQRQTSYNIIFTKKNQIRICLTRKKEESIVKNKMNYYGIDVNVKHNLFCDKNNNTIDYDRKLFNDYISFLKKCDEKHKNKSKKNKELGIKSGFKLSNRDKKIYDKWKIRIKNMLKHKSSDLIKQTKVFGYDHLVMEDLGNFGKSFARNEEFEGFKYNRICKLLNLSDLKNICSSIGNKNDVQVTFVHAPYTSIACKCGCIDDRNRQIQEEFKCVSCGLTAPADAHSGEMIEDRLSVDVLRLKLLTEDKYGLYHPKPLTRPQIKQILHECYDTNGFTSI